MVLDWHEFVYALCKISPSLMLEDPEIIFVLLNGLLVPLACFLSLSVSNPWLFCLVLGAYIKWLGHFLLSQPRGKNASSELPHGRIHFSLILREWGKEASSSLPCHIACLFSQLPLVAFPHLLLYIVTWGANSRRQLTIRWVWRTEITH